MRKTIKRIFASLLTVVMLLSAAPLTGFDFEAEAAETTYKTGDIIEFGSYPQSEVKDAALIKKLDGVSKTWVSYDYYSGTGGLNTMKQSDYMKYSDLSYNGNTYRAVIFSQYRPNKTVYECSSSNSEQYYNGYFTDKIYYFKYEPIKWKVLSPKDGIVISEKIIDSQSFSNTIYYNGDYWNDIEYINYANDYQTSSIRKWLNDYFYNTAFTNGQKSKILNTVLETTTDKVFLLSKKDVTNSTYSFNSDINDSYTRIASGSDYAKCQGLYVNKNSDSTYRGYSWWILRTPYEKKKSLVNYVSEDGDLYGSTIVYYTQGGIRPALRVELNSLDNGENDSDNNRMQIVINNTSLAYFEGDDILIAVSNLKNGYEIIPEKLTLKVSNSKVISNVKIYDYSDVPGLIDELKNYKIIYLKASGIGTTSLSITNSNTGENRIIPITVSKDKVGEYRATNVETHLYDNGLAQDYYNGYTGGIWIADFKYEKAVGGYNFSMNCYNENYCSGVIEVYNSDGKLIEAREIDKYESITKGIYECFKAGYTIIKDTVDADLLSFRSDVTSKCTSITEIFVPQDGYILVTSDSSISTTCAVINAFDMIFTGWSMADDLASIVKGVSSLSKEQIKQLKLSALAKLISQEEYLKFGEKFQKKMVESGAKELTTSGINMFVSKLTIDGEQLLEDMNWSLDGLLKTAFGTGVGIAEDVFEKCTGPFGLTLKSIFLIQDAMDFIYQAKDFGKRMTGEKVFGCCTPVKGTPSGILKKDDVTVHTNGKTSSETVLQSYQIIKGDSYQIDLNSGKILNEFELYEIALYNNGQEVQPSGNVTVYIKSPYEQALVARQNQDGSWQLIDSRMENGMVVFDVDHFCQFVVFNEQTAKVNSVSVGDITLNYKKSATITPIIDADEGAEYTVTYTSSNPSVARVDENGKVYGAKKGSADITVTVTDSYGNSVSDTCKINVKYSFGQWLIVIVLFGWIWY